MLFLRQSLQKGCDLDGKGVRLLWLHSGKSKITWRDKLIDGDLIELFQNGQFAVRILTWFTSYVSLRVFLPEIVEEIILLARFLAEVVGSGLDAAKLFDIFCFRRFVTVVVDFFFEALLRVLGARHFVCLVAGAWETAAVADWWTTSEIFNKKSVKNVSYYDSGNKPTLAIFWDLFSLFLLFISKKRERYIQIWPMEINHIFDWNQKSDRVKTLLRSVHKERKEKAFFTSARWSRINYLFVCLNLLFFY